MTTCYGDNEVSAIRYLFDKMFNWIKKVNVSLTMLSLLIILIMNPNSISLVDAMRSEEKYSNSTPSIFLIDNSHPP